MQVHDGARSRDPCFTETGEKAVSARRTSNRTAAACSVALPPGQIFGPSTATRKVYKLTNHDADLAMHAGHAVRITGELRGDAIRVSTIDMSTSSR